jgi:hypothetical protein
MSPVLALITLSSASFAQDIGTWSAERSPDPLGSSPRYEELRTRLGKEFPRAKLVPLHSLSGPVLGMLDVLVLDGQGKTAVTPAEQAALLAFVQSGGLLVAEGSGPTGASIAAAFGVSAKGNRHGAPHVDTLPDTAFTGLSGGARRFGTADTDHLSTTVAGAMLVGDADGAHLISLSSGSGRAVFVGGMSAFADADAQPPGQFAQPHVDNGALLMNLIGGVLPAPRVGTWSAKRSKVGFASSDAFEVARRELRARMPGLVLVELDQLDPAALSQLDAVLLDSTTDVPPTTVELIALRDFAASGGAVVAQVFGATGNNMAGLYNLAVVGTPQAAVNKLPITAGVQSVALSGPFGAVATYANRYEAALGTTAARTEAVPLVQGPAGTHVVYVPATKAHGAALLLTNLFAFGDPDWSVGGLAGSGNDNLAMLGNFLASSIRPKAPVSDVPPPPQGWQPDYLQASAQAVSGDLEPLQAWMDKHRDESAARDVISHVTSWIAAPPEEIDPRFFPLQGILLGTTTRKELRKSGYKTDGESKWTFDVGGLVWTCLEQKIDSCDLAHTRDSVPAVWAAAGLRMTATPEELVRQFEILGYRATIGVASESPFGRQVVARGFGVLWQADYSLKDQGEKMLVLSARRSR